MTDEAPGYIEEEEDEYEPDSEVTCRECNGRGTTMEGWTCDVCEGRGTLPI